jgi:hypothetical protein
VKPSMEVLVAVPVWEDCIDVVSSCPTRMLPQRNYSSCTCIHLVLETRNAGLGDGSLVQWSLAPELIVLSSFRGPSCVAHHHKPRSSARSQQRSVSTFDYLMSLCSVVTMLIHKAATAPTRP